MRNLRIAVAAAEGTAITNIENALAALGASAELLSSPETAAVYGGLLLPGGCDVEPWRYGQENTASTVVPGLDGLQLAVLDAFVKAGRPVFGICRGVQLLNVYFGGTLCQHISCAQRHKAIEHADGTREDSVHPINAEPGSFLAALYGERFNVNSTHHQAVELPGRELAVCARSDEGIVEAVCHTALPVWGVQFHPERMCFSKARPDTADGARVLEFFLKQCK